MGSKLSAERLETIRHCYAGEGCEGCPSYQEISGAPKDCPIECQAYETAVNSLLSHIAAQDEEIAQLRAVHEAELGVCEQHCEVVKRLRELLREWTDMDPLRYDSEAPCPWCNFDYAKMQHELDCPFVLASAECGIKVGTKALGGEA